MEANSGICKLCLEHKVLCRSHIVPEFFYKPMYDNKHRFFNFSTSPTKEIKYHQKGITERLLCKKCETQLSKYERYTSRLINKQEKIKTVVKKSYIIVSEINYKYLKLFLLSLIWRLSINKQEIYNKVKLGHHEEIIREMILTENPGETHQYPCIITILTLNSESIEGIIVAPTLVKTDGHSVWRVIVGGILLFFYISSHKPSESIIKLSVNANGTAIIPIREITEFQFLHKLIKTVKDTDPNDYI